MYSKTSKDPIPTGDAKLKSSDLTESLEKMVKLIDPNTGVENGKVVLQVEVQSPQQASSADEHIVYQYERWQPAVEWGSSFPGHFLPTDPGKWSSADGKRWSHDMDAVCPSLPDGWRIDKQWYTVANDEDPSGSFPNNFVHVT